MRDPIQLLARFNRQLLVDGVDLSAQQALAGWTAVVATDASAVAATISETLLRYLVGAGVGAVQGPGAAAAATLDTAVAALDDSASATPPVAHLYIATRTYGASVDIVATQAPEGWQQGRSKNARVCTAAFDFDRAVEPLEAPFVGAAAADLLLNHLLKLQPLPAIARFELRDGSEPQLHLEPGGDMVSEPAARATPAHRHKTPTGFSLEALARAPAELAKLLDDARARYPNEACGYILRRDGALTTVVCDNLQDRYHQVEPAVYRRTARTAFKLNERKLAAAIESGAELLCIYHTHCDAGAYFSDEDVACALFDGEPLYPGVSYLVASVYGGELRAMELYGFDADSGRYAPLPHPSTAAYFAVRQRYRQAVRDKRSGAWSWDLATNLMHSDPAMKAQMGYTDEELPDDPESWLNRMHPADGGRFRDSLRALIKGETPLVQEELRVQHRDGSYLWCAVTGALERSAGAKGVVSGTQDDITAAKLVEQRQAYVEQHDALTGMLNVDPFVALLDVELAQGDELTLCVCDLLDFADINHKFDRLTGDDTLIAIAGLLEDQLPEGTLMGRIAGDLFGFVLRAPQREAVATVSALRDAIAAEPFVARNGDSYGIAAQFSVGQPEEDGRFGRDWLDRVLCALKTELPDGVVLVR